MTDESISYIPYNINRDTQLVISTDDKKMAITKETTVPETTDLQKI